jgi:dihydroorotase
VTLGALTRGLAGEQLSEMAALRKAGCVGVSNGLRPMANSLVLRRALEYAATFDLTVFLYASDHWLANDGCAHEGAVATRLGLPGIPEAAETAAVAHSLALIG